MEQLTQYIQADYAILAAVLFCLGRALKAVKRFPNQFIPLALTGCGCRTGLPFRGLPLWGFRQLGGGAV